MKNKLILILAVTVFGNYCYSQVKETVKTKGKTNEMTISFSDMYENSDSEVAKGYFETATGYETEGNLKKAKKYYAKAIKEDPKYVEAYDNLGLICRRLGDYDNAIKNYIKSIELYPEGGMAHQNLAVVYSLQKDYPNSISEYEKLIAISADNPEGYFGLANTYLTLGKYDDALINAQNALDLYRKSDSHLIGDGYYLVGLTYYYKNDKDNAKKYLQLAKTNGVKIHPQLENELLKNAESGLH
jgi:tetratricopeptide (TPR) repeat protein